MLLKQVVCPVLVGREAELHALVQLLEDAVRGRGQTVLLGGDAGIGKSRVCRELKREATARQIRFIEGRCSSAESSVPYGPFMDALRFRLARGEGEVAARVLGPLTTHLAPLFPELSGIDGAAPSPQPSAERPFELIYQVIHRLAGMGPLLFVLEDIHWADPTSRELLQYLSRRTGDDPILLVATYRSDEVDVGHAVRRLLATLSRERLAREVILTPLSQAEVGEMVAAIVDAEPEKGFVAAVWQRTEGNPFFVEELLKALADAGRLGEPGLDARDFARGQLPLTISEAVLARVEPLGRKALEVLAVAAVIGRRFSFDLLRAVSGLAEEELLAIVEQLVTHQLLVEERATGEESYAFRHVLTQEVLYNDIIARRRRLLHRRVAAALGAELAAESALHADALAYHYRLGGDGVRARRYALLAGDQAARLSAWGDAEAHYERALAALEGAAPEPAMEAEVLEKLAEVTWWQSRVDDSLHYAEAALAVRRALGDRRSTAGVLRRLGLLYASQRGEWERALTCLREAMALLAIEPDSAEGARAANDLGRLCLAHAEYPEAERWLTQGLALARELHDCGEEALALAMLGYLAVLRADVAAGLARLEQARALAMGGALSLDRTAAVYSAGIRALEVAREHRRAVEWIRAALAHAGEHGVVAGAAIYQAYGAAVDRRAGRWDQAVATARQAVEELRGAKRAELREALRILGDLHRVRGELETARRAYEEALELGERDAEVGRALVLLAEGRPVEAATDLARVLATRPADDRLYALRVLPFVVEALVRGGRLGDAAEALQRMTAEADGTDFPAARVALAHATGLVRAAQGDVEGARDAYERAAAGWEALEQPYEQARSEVELAALLIDGSRDPSRGTALARRAHAEFTRLGALPDAERARHALRRAGIRTRRPGPRVAQAEEGTNHGLTARERDVLVHLAKGRTNKEIGRSLGITEKTVSIHVSHILAKLACATRTQAAGYAIARQLVT